MPTPQSALVVQTASWQVGSPASSAAAESGKRSAPALTQKQIRRIEFRMSPPMAAGSNSRAPFTDAVVFVRRERYHGSNPRHACRGRLGGDTGYPARSADSGPSARGPEDRLLGGLFGRAASFEAPPSLVGDARFPPSAAVPAAGDPHATAKPKRDPKIHTRHASVHPISRLFLPIATNAARNLRRLSHA
jgi:hypothetical protein